MIVKRLTGLRKLALTMFLFACLYQVKGAVQDGESGEYLHRIRQIDLPLIEISTVDGVEPTCVFVQPPPGVWEMESLGIIMFREELLLQ